MIHAFCFTIYSPEGVLPPFSMRVHVTADDVSDAERKVRAMFAPDLEYEIGEDVIEVQLMHFDPTMN